MEYGLYAPIVMASAGTAEGERAISEALNSLPSGRRDAQFDLSTSLLMRADALGFNLVLFAERHLGADISAWVLASALGARFENIRPLVAVHPGLWNPVLVAKLAASLDRICVGRMALNIVNGWFDREFEMFGGKVLQGDDRYQRTSEFLEILIGLWTHETFSFNGKFYNIENGQLLLKPASPKPPEFFSVSRGDAGIELIARTSDWWFVELPKSDDPLEALREIEASITGMRTRAERYGRTIRFAINPFVSLGSNFEEAYQTSIKRMFEFDPERAEARFASSVGLDA